MTGLHLSARTSMPRSPSLDSFTLASVKADKLPSDSSENSAKIMDSSGSVERSLGAISTSTADSASRTASTRRLVSISTTTNGHKTADMRQPTDAKTNVRDIASGKKYQLLDDVFNTVFLNLFLNKDVLPSFDEFRTLLNNVDSFLTSLPLPDKTPLDVAGPPLGQGVLPKPPVRP